MTMTPGEQTFSDDKAGAPHREPAKASKNVAEAREEEAREDEAREDEAREEGAREEGAREEKAGPERAGEEEAREHGARTAANAAENTSDFPVVEAPGKAS